MSPPIDDSTKAKCGLESNPLSSTINLGRWISCLPRWILKTKSQFARCLRSSFAIMRRSDQTATTVFPLPLLSVNVWSSSGPGLSKKRWKSLSVDRLINVWVLVLDFLYLGRWPTSEELQRSPNLLQQKVYRRLRTLVSVCGDALQEFSLCHGRTGPELGATLFQLEKFLEQDSSFADPYLRQPIHDFAETPGLFPADLFPELEPYKSLDAARLRLVGTGKWDMQSWLTGSLWLPFQEPSFLLHGLDVDPDDVPDFSKEDPKECLKLAKIWDTRGLLFLAPRPLAPGFFSRVFNTHKNRECDRQIGDRRLPNQSEFHVDGPSKFLLQGQQLVCLHAERFKEVIRASITDRRDFYLQAAVSDERAVSNMLPFALPTHEFEGTTALADFRKRWNTKADVSREKAGDDLKNERKRRTKVQPEPDALYPCFKSLFQGDHLGVEFALQSHSILLSESGLLREHTHESNATMSSLLEKDGMR